MTGGTPEARRINRRLARVAQSHRLCDGPRLRPRAARVAAIRSKPSTCVRWRPTPRSLPTSARCNSTRDTASTSAGVSSSCCTPTRWCFTSIRCKRRCSPKAIPASAACWRRSQRLCGAAVSDRREGGGLGHRRCRRSRALRRRRGCGGRRGRGRHLVERSRALPDRRAVASRALRRLRGLGDSDSACARRSARGRALGDSNRERRHPLRLWTLPKRSHLAPISSALRVPSCAPPTKASRLRSSWLARYSETLRVAMFCVGARRLADLRGTLTARDVRCRRRSIWTPQMSTAESLTRRHYENFSVASRFVDAANPARPDAHLCVLPYDRRSRRREPLRKRTRPPRTLARRGRRALRRSATGSSGARCARSRQSSGTRCRRNRFSISIAANVQDQRVTRYRTWDELIGYCRLSAAPVGRMVLARLRRERSSTRSGSPTTSASGCNSRITLRT